MLTDVAEILDADQERKKEQSWHKQDTQTHGRQGHCINNPETDLS